MEPVGANASAPEQVFWSAIFQVITVNDEMAKTRCIEVLSCDVPDCSPACPQPGDEREFSVFFLRNACRIPDQKIRAVITIYPDLRAEDCIKYWAEAAKISPKSFTKCVTIIGRHKSRRVTYGMCSIVVSSTYLKAKMLEWLRLMPEQLMKRSYYESIANEAGMV